MRKVVGTPFYRRFFMLLFLLCILCIAYVFDFKEYGSARSFEGFSIYHWNQGGVVEVPKCINETVPKDRGTGSDIITFLQHLKNPCWYQETLNTNLMRMDRRLRCLPYFFLAGFPKCATSDLIKRIAGHPDVIKASSKEINWWDMHRFHGLKESKGYSDASKKSFDSYLDNFKNISGILEASCENEESSLDAASPCGRLISGDGTIGAIWKNDYFMMELRKLLVGPEGQEIWERFSQNRIEKFLPKYNKSEILQKDYTAVPFTHADVIHSLLPDARIIAILRDPVERLYSGYNYMHPSKKKSPQIFDEVTTKAMKEFNLCLSKKTERECAYQKLSDWNYIRSQCGLYSLFIKDWLSIFPREQLLFIRTEDFKADMRATLEKVYRHLGLDPLDEAQMERVLNQPYANVYTKDYEPMLNSTRTKLAAFYSKYNRQLADILRDEAFTWKEHRHYQQIDSEEE